MINSIYILLERMVELLPGCLSICPSGTGVQCNHMMHFSVDLMYGGIVQRAGQSDTKACLPTPSCLFPVPPGREVGHGLWMCKLGMISQERLKRELLLSANRKSYMLHRLAQLITLSDHEWPFRIVRHLCGS